MANSMKNSVETSVGNGSYHVTSNWQVASRSAGRSPESVTAVRQVSTLKWDRRAVRCVHCRELAHEEAREQLGNGEVAIRYCCDNCGWPQTRRHRSDELAASRAS